MKTSSWFSALVLALAWSEDAFAAKIACVGDSITYGYNLSNPTTESYPARLQALLGREHTVQNFGVSGTTVLKQSDHPYWGESAYTASGTFGPDIVIVMLGTNDTKPQNWTRQANFVTDYQDLVDHYRMLGAVVYVATPPPVYGSGAFDIQPDVLANQVVPRVRQLATDMNAPLVDVFTALSGKPQNFPDNVHPNAAGAQLIAETVRAALNSNVGGAGGAGNAGGTAGAATAGGTSRAGGAGGTLAQGGRAGGSAGATAALGGAGQGGAMTIGAGGVGGNGATQGGLGGAGASGDGNSGTTGASASSGGSALGGAFGSTGGTNSAGAPGAATGGVAVSGSAGTMSGGGVMNGATEGMAGGRATSGTPSQGSDTSGCSFTGVRSPQGDVSVAALLGALALRGRRRARDRNSSERSR